QHRTLTPHLLTHPLKSTSRCSFLASVSFSFYRAPRSHHSFPTRRSSDLARGLPRTRRFRLKRAARHRRGRALHGAQDVANPHGGRIARKRVAASLPAHAGQKPRPHERTGKLLEIFKGDALALRHFAQRHLVLWPGLRKTHHEPERIAPLRRHEHRRPSLLAQTA